MYKVELPLSSPLGPTSHGLMMTVDAALDTDRLYSGFKSLKTFEELW